MNSERATEKILDRPACSTMGLIGSAPEIEDLAKSVDDDGGCYFVPA